LAGLAVVLLAGWWLIAPAAVSAHAGIEELRRRSSEEVSRHPSDPEVRLRHARVLQLAAEWDAALAELDVAERRGADPQEVGATRAAILLDAGRSQAALLELDRLLARYGGAAGLRFERGRALRALGRSGEAAAEFGSAVATMAEPQPEHIMAQRDALVAAGRRAEAVAALDAGMRRVGRVVSLQLAAVDLEVELGRYDAARDRLDELLARGPANPAWVARRGDILALAGQPTAARAEYARALALLGPRTNDRRAKAFAQLARQLETKLTSASNGGDRP
jgi:tetratricopeptide (TPR) repeat protein